MTAEERIDLSDLDISLIWGPDGAQSLTDPKPDEDAILTAITDLVRIAKLDDRVKSLLPTDKSSPRPSAEQLQASLSGILVPTLQAVYRHIVMNTTLNEDRDAEIDRLQAEVQNLQDRLDAEAGGRSDDSGTDADPSLPTRKRTRAGKSPKSTPFTALEQAIAERHDDFGFQTPSWKRCKWTPNSTKAAVATYNATVAKLSGGEKITTKVVVDATAAEMDSWIGRTPGEKDVEKVRKNVERLYTRFRSLNAPGGSSAAVAAAVEKTFDESLLDSRFRAAADAAAKLELYQLAGPMGAMAANGIKGAAAYWKGQIQPSGGPRGGNPRNPKPKWQPKGKGQADRAGEDDATIKNKEIVCFKCNEKGHPKRLCPN